MWSVGHRYQGSVGRTVSCVTTWQLDPRHTPRYHLATTNAPALGARLVDDHALPRASTHRGLSPSRPHRDRGLVPEQQG